MLPFWPKPVLEPKELGETAFQSKTQWLLKPPGGFSCANKCERWGEEQPTFPQVLSSESGAGPCILLPAGDGRPVCCSCKLATRKTGKPRCFIQESACVLNPPFCPSPPKKGDFPFLCPDISACRSGECVDAHLENCLRLLAVCVFNHCLCCGGSKDRGVSLAAPYSPLRRQRGHSQPAQESCGLCSLDLEDCLTEDHSLPAAVESKDRKDGGFKFLGTSLKSLLSLDHSLLCVNNLSMHAVKLFVSIYP